MSWSSHASLASRLSGWTSRQRRPRPRHRIESDPRQSTSASYPLLARLPEDQHPCGGASTGHESPSQSAQGYVAGLTFRRTLAFSKSRRYHEWMSWLSVVQSNFRWAHGSWRIKDENGVQHRTPAMVAGLTDRIWSTREWLLYPVLGGRGSSQDTT